MNAFPLIAGGVALIALLLGKSNAKASNQLPTPTQPVAPKPTLASSTTIRQGSTGPRVVELQARLNEYGVVSPSLQTDGVFDAEVTEAVLRFQSTHKNPATGKPLAVDGVVGPQTWAALAAG